MRASIALTEGRSGNIARAEREYICICIQHRPSECIFFFFSFFFSPWLPKSCHVAWFVFCERKEQPKGFPISLFARSKPLAHKEKLLLLLFFTRSRNVRRLEITSTRGRGRYLELTAACNISTTYFKADNFIFSLSLFFFLLIIHH